MVTGFDHIVIVVRDLEAAINEYWRLGFTVVRGGRHPGIGTHNALIAFADGAYFELIAFLPPVSDTPHPWYAALQQGGGLTDFCVRTPDLEADAAAFRQAGAEIGKPFRMSRQRPDGYKLSWVLATVEGALRGVVPFFIRDETPRDERVPRERSHRNGVTGIKTLTLAVSDVPSIARIYQTALGAVGEAIKRADLGGDGLHFMLGAHELQLLASDGAGLLEERLRTRGPSPFEVVLSGPGGARRPLDVAAAARARIVID
ncbi:MAG: VOC family protein [Candidatus Binataceae bacterium]